MAASSYDDKNITTLDWVEHIRKRPGMYIGDIGNGSGYHDCVYILMKEVIDNAVDEGGDRQRRGRVRDGLRPAD